MLTFGILLLFAVFLIQCGVMAYQYELSRRMSETTAAMQNLEEAISLTFSRWKSPETRVQPLPTPGTTFAPSDQELALHEQALLRESRKRAQAAAYRQSPAGSVR